MPRPAEPIAGISQLHEGPDNSLLILGAGPAQHWKGKPNPWQIGGGEHSACPHQEQSLVAALDGWFDTVVDRVYSGDGKLIARVKVRAGVIQIVDASHVRVIRTASDGRIETEIWRIAWSK